MSSYEFWDELGKIFNAVVAYQEKNVEFNKRFINPWIRLGNVFDKQDRNKEAISAYQKAIEIDPDNAQNWFELGNIHFKMESYPEAMDAFNRAMELDPSFGWPYNNLALTLVSQGNHVQAIPLYRKAIELLAEAKDKAVAWNRLGNVYRKLNEYDLAVEAFQKADELDRDNAGFRDTLDEVPAEPTVVQASVKDSSEPVAALSVSPIELIVADGRADEVAAQATEPSPVALPAIEEAATRPTQTAEVEAAEAISDAALESTAQAEAVIDGEQATVALATAEAGESPALAPEPVSEVLSGSTEQAEVHEVAAEAIAEPTPEAEATPLAEVVESEASIAEAPAEAMAEASEPSAAPSEAAVSAEVADEPDESSVSREARAAVEETVTVVVQSTIETFTESVPVADTATETSEAALSAGVPETKEADPEPETAVAVAEISQPSPDAAVEPEPAAGAAVDAEASPLKANSIEATDEEISKTKPIAAVTSAAEVMESAVAEPAAPEAGPASPDQSAEAETTSIVPAPDHNAYEEFLKDSNEPLGLYDPATGETAPAEVNGPIPQEPVTKIDPSGELQIEMDTKNAHVWNELGNVYFNTGAYDDAIIAYSKAIELDRWFAWPYSNLALAYVQKRRFVEAILLYQRSIELFANEKDKAISWNRLGNVYRRLNDYENAIAAYQRADRLDPDNTTLSLQSRFSLLGSYSVDQEHNYVS